MKISNPASEKSLKPENPSLVDVLYEKVLGGESFDTIPFGYRRHVRNKAVDEVKRGALSVSAYMQHFGR